VNNQGKYSMVENKNQTSVPKQSDKAPSPRQPNEQGSISVTGFVRIFDPKTKETYVETRT
jgi:hypothetical protein